MKSKFLILAFALFVICGATPTSLARPPKLPTKVTRLYFRKLCPECSKYDLVRWRSRLKYEAQDLNGDKVPEYLVWVETHEWCGQGNCTVSVYKRVRDGYKLLVEGTSLRVLNRTTNGFRDLESKYRTGACTRTDGEIGRDIHLSVFKYTSSKYREIDLGQQCQKRSSN